MTPEEAKSWLQTTDDYEFDEGTVCDALETVAGLRYEYAVLEDVGYWRQRGEWLSLIHI